MIFVSTFLKLPNFYKNAYLAIHLNNQAIYANLAYADYDSGRNYILSDITYLFGAEEKILSTEFWKAYFQSLSKKFNWQFFREKEILPVIGEGIGVSNIVFHILDSKINKEELLGNIREVSFNINVVVVTGEYIRNLLAGLSRKVEYDDILQINLDPYDFSVTRYTSAGVKQLLNRDIRSGGDLYSADIHWDNRANLVANIHNSKLKAFLSIETEVSKINNIWANFVINPTTRTTSVVLEDLIRSYVTVQMLSILNDNGSKFEEIGLKGKSTLVIITGALTRTLKQKKLLIALLDGFEMRGEIDFLFDEYGKTMTFGKTLVTGGESENFVFAVHDLFQDMVKVVVADTQASQARKVIFSGKLESAELGEKEVYALAPEMTTVQLENSKAFITGNFVQKAFWGNQYQAFEVYSDPKNISYSSFVIDGRHKPVVYGPDVRSNRFKMNSWINENN